MPATRPGLRSSALPRGGLGLIFGLVVVLAGLGIAWVLTRPPTDVPTTTSAATRLISTSAPAFTLPDLAGTPVQRSAVRGRPVWINFWATWCPPCKTEMPLMEERYQRYQAQGLVILGLDLQESPADVRAWVGARFHWRFLIDTRGALADRYQIEGVPTHLFIDRVGVVRGVVTGALAADEMDRQLAAILTPCPQQIP